MKFSNMFWENIFGALVKNTLFPIRKLVKTWLKPSLGNIFDVINCRNAMPISNARGAFVFSGKFSVFCIPRKKMSSVTSCHCANCLR